MRRALKKGEVVKLGCGATATLTGTGTSITGLGLMYVDVKHEIPIPIARLEVPGRDCISSTQVNLRFSSKAIKGLIRFLERADATFKKSAKRTKETK